MALHFETRSRLKSIMNATAVHPTRAAAAEAVGSCSLSSAIEQEKGIFVTIMDYACSRVEEWGCHRRVSKRWHCLLGEEELEQRFLGEGGQLWLYPVGWHASRSRDDEEEEGGVDGDDSVNDEEGGNGALILDGMFVRKTRMPSVPSEDFGLGLGLGLTRTMSFISPICEALAAAADQFSYRRREFLPDLFHGRGMVLHPRRYVYRGSFVDGKREGRGMMIDVTIARCHAYDGVWTNDRKHGHGVQQDCAGCNKGAFCDGDREGPATYHWEYGAIDKCLFANDRRTGVGVLWSKDRTRTWRTVNGFQNKEISHEEARRITEKILFLEVPTELDNGLE